MGKTSVFFHENIFSKSREIILLLLCLAVCPSVVLSAPVIDSFAPSSLIYGAQIRIYGSGFVNGAKIYFQDSAGAGNTCTAIFVDSTLVIFRLCFPAAFGNGFLRVINPDSSVSVDKSLTVFQSYMASPPFLLSPVDSEAVTYTGQVCFRWSDVVWADHYEIYIFNEDGSIMDILNSGYLTVSKTAAVQSGKNYEWEISAVSGVISRASVRWSFYTKLQKPELNSPGGLSGPGPEITGPGVNLSWNGVYAANSYTLWVSDALNGVVTYPLGNVTNMTLSPLVEGLSYSWYVQAKTATGIGNSDLSSTYYFYVPTATFTQTSTATFTQTSSYTETITMTHTATFTQTPSDTETLTMTPTPESTNTGTITPTATTVSTAANTSAQNYSYPNPFVYGRDSAVTFVFSPSSGARVVIYDVALSSIIQLPDSAVFSEEGRALWDVKGPHGAMLPGGIYFAAVISGKSKKIIKFTVVK